MLSPALAHFELPAKRVSWPAGRHQRRLDAKNPPQSHASIPPALHAGRMRAEKACVRLARAAELTEMLAPASTGCRSLGGAAGCHQNKSSPKHVAGTLFSCATRAGSRQFPWKQPLSYLIARILSTFRKQSAESLLSAARKTKDIFLFYFFF